MTFQLNVRFFETPTGWKFFGNLMDSKELGGEVSCFVFCCRHNDISTRLRVSVYGRRGRVRQHFSCNCKSSDGVYGSSSPPGPSWRGFWGCAGCSLTPVWILFLPSSILADMRQILMHLFHRAGTQRSCTGTQYYTSNVIYLAFCAFRTCAAEVRFAEVPRPRAWRSWQDGHTISCAPVCDSEQRSMCPARRFRLHFVSRVPIIALKT